MRQILKTEDMLSCDGLLGSGDRELTFSIILQNLMHPKNSNRTEAVKSGSYQELMTHDEGRKFLVQLLSHNLKQELMGVESAAKAQVASLQQMQDVKLILEAPDVYHAAAVLIQQNFYNGKGDRTALIEVVLNTDPKTIPDLARKLKLITQSEFYGYKIYNDKLCNTLQIKQQSIYRLWLHCCRRHNAMTAQEMIDFAPYLREKIEVWDKFVDNNGKTTLNMDEYMAYRKQMAEAAKVAKLQAKAEKNKKNKI